MIYQLLASFEFDSGEMELVFSHLDKPSRSNAQKKKQSRDWLAEYVGTNFTSNEDIQRSQTKAIKDQDIHGIVSIFIHQYFNIWIPYETVLLGAKKDDKWLSHKMDENERLTYSLFSKYLVKFWYDKKPSVRLSFLLLTMADSVLAMNRRFDGSNLVASTNAEYVEHDTNDTRHIPKSLDALVRLVLTDKNAENFTKFLQKFPL